MPASNPGVGATASEVWAHATRKLTGMDGQPRTDLMGEDASFEAGTGTRKARIDAAISTRAPEAGGNLAAVKTRVDAQLVDETPTEGTLTTNLTEQTLVEKDFTASPKVCHLEGLVDLSNMQVGDTITIRQYMQIKPAGAYGKYAEESYTSIQSLPMLAVVTRWARYKIKVTLQQTAGIGGKACDYQFFTKKQA